MKYILMWLLAFGSNSAFAREIKVLRLETGTTISQDHIKWDQESILTHAIDVDGDEVKVQCHKTGNHEIGFIFFNHDQENTLMSFGGCKALSDKVRQPGITNIVIEKVSTGRGRNKYLYWQYMGVDKRE